MLKNASLVFVLMSISSAFAATPVATVGPADCKIVEPSLSAQKVSWAGPCVNGYAEGEGKLDWTENGEQISYSGALQRGRAHGDGYLVGPFGSQYEGSFREGKFDGMGILVTRDKTRYDGNWKAGLREGSGSIVYSTGGRYDGNWKSNYFHGRGKATYIGGQVIEGEFIDGIAPGIDEARAAPVTLYAIKEKRTEMGAHIPREVATGFRVPVKKSYGEMTPDEVLTIRSVYPLLHPNDEPPYPLHGTRHIYDEILAAQRYITDVGLVRINVLVGSDGVPISVDVLASPNPGMTKIVGLALMNEKYKPALCSGKPCPMVYPFSSTFTVR